MKYAITGAAGHVATPLVLELLTKGHTVTVIGRSAKHLEKLVNAGAKAAIGSVEDEAFLSSAFAGSDAVFCVFPANNSSTGIKAFIEDVAFKYKSAIEKNKIRHIVSVSSVGAHLAEGAGPVSGLYRAEQLLNSIPHTSVLHLRPVYFFTNLFAQIDAIRYMNMMAGNFELDRFPIVDPADVGRIAAKRLINLDFKSHSYEYIAGDEVSTNQIASEIGNAIGKPDLRWVRISNEQMKDVFIQAGMSNQMAGDMTEMFDSFDKGRMTSDYFKIGPAEWGKTRLSDFANEFSKVYHSVEQATPLKA